MPRKAKKQRLLSQDDKGKRLEEEVFGLLGGFEDSPEDDNSDGLEDMAKEELATPELFFEDTRGERLAAGEDVEEDGGSDDGSSPSTSSAPSDDDDERGQDGMRGGGYGSGGEDGEAAGPEGDPCPRRGTSPGTAMEAARDRDGRDRPPQGARERCPVWSDEDAAALTAVVDQNARMRKLRVGNAKTMDGQQYESSLRKQHASVHPRTQWAQKRSGAAAASLDDDEGGDGEELLQAATGLTQQSSLERRLPPGQLEVTRMKDANQHRPSDAVLRAVRFHPNGQVLLTGGLDKKLRLFQVDGVRNSLLQEVHLEDMPITNAAFAPGGAVGDGEAANSVVIVGRRPFAYLFDLRTARTERLVAPSGGPARSLERLAIAPPSAHLSGGDPLVAFAGDGGFIPLLSMRSRQWVANLKVSGNVRALAFSHDGRELFSTGDNGMIHAWDLRTRRCRFAFVDAGNAGSASSLSVSADGRYLASGSRAGVVNVYSRTEVEAAAARAASGALAMGSVAIAPVRELMNLTTDADTLEFSPDSQMLAMASRMKRDALRLVHLPTLGVFTNWPTSRSPLNYVHSLNFSPHCGLLAVGNAKGRALLYRLHHYQRA